jgi:hypothetical protein
MSRNETESADTQLVELAGRNWLASQLQHAKIEVAKPERDREIDLIAYLDRHADAGQFVGIHKNAFLDRRGKVWKARILYEQAVQASAITSRTT